MLKPKNMINISEILAKSKKSGYLYDSLKIYRHLKYGPAKTFPKKGLPSGAKDLVQKAFLENQDFTQKSPTP